MTSGLDCDALSRATGSASDAKKALTPDTRRIGTQKNRKSVLYTVKSMHSSLLFCNSFFLTFGCCSCFDVASPAVVVRQSSCTL